MYFLEFIKMSELMIRTIKRKYLFWFDFDDKVKIVEFKFSKKIE